MPMLSADDFRALHSGDILTHEGRTLRFVRYRAGKATCVDVDTGARVNLFPVPASPAGAAGEATPPAAAGARTEQE